MRQWLLLILLVFTQGAYSQLPGKGPTPQEGEEDPLCSYGIAAKGTQAHLERLAQLGEIAGGAVHDINNLVTGVIFQLEAALARQEVGNQEQLIQAIEQARQLARMARAITDFTRDDTGRPVHLRLENQVSRMLEVCNYFLRNHQVSFTADEDLFDVVLTSVLLDQVLLNILVNADKAMAKAGTVRIFASNVILTEAIPYDRGVVKPDVYVRLDISDTGVGIPGEILEKIFTRHFTTRGQNGTGLGLSTVDNIMQAHGGHVLVQSELGKGTTFTLYFPASVEGPAIVDNSDIPVKSDTIRVLLIDDDEILVEAQRAVLSTSQAKYEILSATTVEQARRVFGANKDHLDMVIIDYGLRGIRGTELADEFRAERPALMVLITSGINRPNLGYPIFLKDPANNLDIEIQRLIKEADED
ncbi:MAG: ATP-binding protein [Bdellovibrionota bacterium]